MGSKRPTIRAALRRMLGSGAIIDVGRDRSGLEKTQDQDRAKGREERGKRTRSVGLNVDEITHSISRVFDPQA